MKLPITILALFATAAVIFASLTAPYNNSKQPSLSLPDAYNQAMLALGTATNQLHCISANAASSFSADGEWLFTFYTTNSKPKWVTVEFNGKVHIEDMIIR